MENQPVTRAIATLEAWAAFDTEKSFYVVDHTTRKRWPGNLANLSLAAPFDYTGSSPVREVRIRVQDNDMGGMFSFHDDSGASSWARPRWEMWGLPGEETGGAFVRGTIGLGRWFTMMRAGDGKVSPPKICPNHLDADWRSIFDDIGPQGTHDWQPISVWVRDNLFSGTWAIHHEDGPIIGLSPGGSQVQSAWDEFGNPQSIGWFELTGSVDNALPWNVVNESTGANFGQSTLIDYGPWYSGMAAPGTVGLANVPLWRESHELWIVDDNDHAWRVSAESHTYSMIEYSDSSGITSQVWFFSVSSAGDPSGTPWRIEDRTVGDFSPYASGGVASFSEWVPPPSAMQFKISPTRWNHDLYLVQPFRPWSLLEKGSIQGMWTIDPNGATQFTNYGFFDGSAAFLQGSEWWLLDATNGDISPQQTGVDLFSWIASDSEMDSDSDGLPDWYESTIQTDPFSSDSDNDGIGDFDEVRLGLSPTSAIVWLSPGEGRLQVYTRLE